MTGRALPRAAFTLAAVSAALFADSLLYSAVVPVLPLYAAEHGASVAAIGLLFASYAAALLAVTPFVAVVSDTAGHRRMLVTGMSGVTAATLLFATADSYGALLASRSLQGAAAAVVWTSGVALVAEQVDEERLGAMMGIVMAAVSAGLLLGPPVAGALTDAVGFRDAFLVLAAAAGGCAVLQPFVAGSSNRPSPRRGLRALRSRGLLRTLLAVAVAAGCLALLEPLVPLDLHGRLGADSGQIGLVFGAATLAHLVVAPFAGALADRYARMPLIGWGLVAMGGTVPLLALPGSLLTTVLVLALFAVAYSFVLVPALSETAVEGRRAGGGFAAAYAAFNVAFAVGMMTGPAAGSVLAATFSADSTLLLASVVLIGVGLYERRSSALPSTGHREPPQNGAHHVPIPPRRSRASTEDRGCLR